MCKSVSICVSCCVSKEEEEKKEDSNKWLETGNKKILACVLLSATRTKRKKVSSRLRRGRGGRDGKWEKEKREREGKKVFPSKRCDVEEEEEISHHHGITNYRYILVSSRSPCALLSLLCFCSYVISKSINRGPVTCKPKLRQALFFLARGMKSIIWQIWGSTKNIQHGRAACTNFWLHW